MLCLCQTKSKILPPFLIITVISIGFEHHWAPNIGSVPLKQQELVALYESLVVKARKLAVDYMPDMHEFAANHTGGVPVLG